MKKLFSGRFLFILLSSVAVLIVLTIGAFYLFDDSDDYFIKSGYVLNPLSEKSEKYFFEENTAYKKNLSSMIEFTDVDDKEVSVLYDSFVHYNDESLAFLKNGAILDLDSINGGSAVKFYNITNESVISKKDNNYIIKSQNGDINLRNFIGRINENKYIVVGDLDLKLAGNEKLIEGEYFEIVYVEEGIVNIENKEVKYQVTAADTKINVADDLIIDLGDKKITSGDEDIMSITTITIDGNENIEIIPQPGIGTPGNGTGSGGGAGGSGDGNGTGSGSGSGSGDGTGSGGGAGGSGDGDGTGSGSGSGSGDGTGSGGGAGGSGDGNGTGSGSGSGSGDGTGSGGGAGGSGDGDGTGSGDGSGGSGGGNGGAAPEIQKTKELIINLKDAKIGSTRIDVIFDIYNAEEEDTFKLQVINLDSGRTVDVIPTVEAEKLISVSLLSPDTKYLFTVINNQDGNKYFQKIFETTSFGIKLEKGHVTSGSINYKVIIEEGTELTDAVLTLKKFNEETNKLEPVVVSYYDKESETTKTVEKRYPINNGGKEITGTYEFPIDGLESNTIYTAVLDEFSIESSNFKELYNITSTTMTLKATPKFNKMSVVEKVGEGGFELSIGEIDDPDNAITKYTYMIYNEIDDTEAIEPIVQTNASPIQVKIGTEKNQLSNDTNYYYKVIIEYHDNEKYVEFIKTSDIIFKMHNDPVITIKENKEETTHDTIAGTITLTDNSCLVSMPGRKCHGSSTAILKIKKINSKTGILEEVPGTSHIIEFTDIDDTENENLVHEFKVSGLEEGQTYHISVEAILNNDKTNSHQELKHTEESTRQITTKTLSSFYVNWDPTLPSTSKHVVNLGAKFAVNKEDNEGTLSADDTAAAIKKVVLSIHQGSNIEDVWERVPFATKTYINEEGFNIKGSFYDKKFVITTDETFGYDINMLKALNKINEEDTGKLDSHYTITIKAYYDYEETEEVALTNNVISYEINSLLLLEDMSDPVVTLKEITHSENPELFPDLNNPGTVIGYHVSAYYDRAGLLLNKLEPKKINFYVYDTDGKKVDFYILQNDKLKKVNVQSFTTGELNIQETQIYMNYGTEYNTKDKEMRRGNEYYIGFEVEVKNGEETKPYPHTGPGDIYENYEKTLEEKENPYWGMYIASSTPNSIKYRYTIKDIDNAIYKTDDEKSYSLYYKVNSEKALPIELTKVEGAPYTQLKGEFTISELNKNDQYSIYYRKNIKKTGNFDKDVIDNFEGDNAKRLFDGYYDHREEEYNFKYQIFNDQTLDNKVTIKILASDAIMARVLSYNVTLSSPNSEKDITKEVWNLSTCPDDDSSRCIFFDYIELKNAGMKSEQNDRNPITVKIKAYYDNGLTGFDYKVGKDKEYQYCILQNNTISGGNAGYISLTGGNRPVIWDATLGKSKGYYTQCNSNGTITYQGNMTINYQIPNTSSKIPILAELQSDGYYNKTIGKINQKLVTEADMTSEGEDNFWFNSITPKVNVNLDTRLLNGSVQNLSLTGADIKDFKEEDGEYFLYVDVYEDKDFTIKARPSVKAKLDATNIRRTTSAYIDGLEQNTTYYFTVSAYLYKGDKIEYTRLYDGASQSEYVYKTYNFTSYAVSDIFDTFDLTYVAKDDPYGDRELTATIKLNEYKNKTKFNFDLVYAFCEAEDSDCGPGENESHLFTKSIPQEKVNGSVEDNTMLTDYNIEFDKDYKMFAYAVIDKYQKISDDKWETKKETIILNRMKSKKKLEALETPSFTVTRNAITTDDGKHAIKVTVIPHDKDKTFVNGEYFIKVTDSTGKIAGTLEITDANGNLLQIDDYSTHGIDARVTNQSMIINNLKADSSYSIVVYSKAYLNNYSEETIGETPEETKNNRTKVIETKPYLTYTTDEYGVAIGDVSYTATPRSVEAKFTGGTNFTNVLEVTYTIGYWGNTSAQTISGTYYKLKSDAEANLGIQKDFFIDDKSGDWHFVIDPNGLVIDSITRSVELSFKIKADNPLGYVIYDRTDNETFYGSVFYNEYSTK